MPRGRSMCGFRSFFAQMRCTVLGEMPTWRPMLRTLQRLRPFGGRVASVMTRAALASGKDGLRPLATSVRQAVEPCLLEPRRPDRDRPHRCVHVCSNILDLHPVQTQQNDLGPEPIAMLGRAPIGPTPKLRPNLAHFSTVFDIDIIIAELRQSHVTSRAAASPEFDDWPSVRDNQQFAKTAMTAQAAIRLRLRLWVTCGRRLGKNFLTFLQHWSGAGHVSGLFVRRGWPLALMLCADQVPIVFMHSEVR